MCGMWLSSSFFDSVAKEAEIVNRAHDTDDDLECLQGARLRVGPGGPAMRSHNARPFRVLARAIAMEQERHRVRSQQVRVY